MLEGRVDMTKRPRKTNLYGLCAHGQRDWRGKFKAIRRKAWRKKKRGGWGNGGRVEVKGGS